MCGGGGPSSIRSFVVEGDKARQRAERLFGGERLVPEVRAGGCVSRAPLLDAHTIAYGIVVFMSPTVGVSFLRVNAVACLSFRRRFPP